jgi:hypothetical protein
MKTRRKWLIGGLAALLLAVAGAAVAQLPNTLNVSSAPSGTAPAIRAAGIDANIGINLVPKGSGTVQVSGTPIVVGGGTTTSLTINPGPLNVTGQLFMTPGTAVGLKQVGGAVVFNTSATFTPAAAAVEEDAWTIALPANTLSATHQYLSIETFATFAANANNKRIRLYFGATTICDSGAVGYNDRGFRINVTLYRTGAATQKALCTMHSAVLNAATWAATGTNSGWNNTTPAEALAGAVTLRATLLNATAAADSSTLGANVVWYPAGQ